MPPARTDLGPSAAHLAAPSVEGVAAARPFLASCAFTCVCGVANASYLLSSLLPMCLSPTPSSPRRLGPRLDVLRMIGIMLRSRYRHSSQTLAVSRAFAGTRSPAEARPRCATCARYSPAHPCIMTCPLAGANSTRLLPAVRMCPNQLRRTHQTFPVLCHTHRRSTAGTRRARPC